jgi:hypothetical protein
VVGDDRYHDLAGTYGKKVKGEMADKWFLHQGTLQASSYLVSPPSTTTGAGAITSNYNAAADMAIARFSNYIDATVIPAVNAMILKDTGNNPISTYTAAGLVGGQPVQPTYGGTLRFNVVGNADINFSEIDLITKLKPGLDQFKADMEQANAYYMRNVLNLLSFKNPNGVRRKVIKESASGQEASVDKAWSDIFHLVNVETKFFEETVTTARSYIEDGLPGSTWKDGNNGTIDGRRNLHIYAERKFEEYLVPDVHKFTNDETYDPLERAGMSMMKAINVATRDSNGVVTTQNRAFLDSLSFQKDQRYEVSDLTSGVVTQYARGLSGTMELKRKFGTKQTRYLSDVIADIYSGEYVYSKAKDGGLLTDRRGMMSIGTNASGVQVDRYYAVDNAIRNMRERQEYIPGSHYPLMGRLQHSHHDVVHAVLEPCHWMEGIQLWHKPARRLLHEQGI